MAHRSTELLRAVRDELRKNGAVPVWSYVNGGSHQVVVFTHGGREGRITFPFSPRSSATDYVRQKVRRVLRKQQHADA